MELPLKPLKKLVSLVGLNGQTLKSKKPKIFISMPTYRHNIENLTRDSLNATIKYLREMGYPLTFHQPDSALLAKSRCDAVDAAVEAEADYLMFVDSDMVFEPNHIEMLLAHKKDVVGGLCVKRVPPYTSTVYMYRSEKGSYVPIDTADPNAIILDALIPCDGTGAAFLLIKMSVFDDMEKPYFSMPPVGWMEVVAAAKRVNENNVEALDELDKSFDELDKAIEFADSIDSSCGEDLFFCNRLRQVGVEVFVDTGVLIGHMGEFPFTYIDRLGLVEVQGVEKKDADGTGASGGESGVPAHDGAGITALLRATRKAKEVPPVPGE